MARSRHIVTLGVYVCNVWSITYTCLSPRFNVWTTCTTTGGCRQHLLTVQHWNFIQSVMANACVRSNRPYRKLF